MPFFGLCVCCLAALVGFYLGALGLIIADFGTLAGVSVVMVLRLGLVRLLLLGFWMSFSFSSGIVLPLVLTFLLGPFLFGISLRVLLVRSLLGACLKGVKLLSFLLVRGGPSALSAALGGVGVCLAGGSGGGVKRVRLFRKTPAHLARQGVSGVQVRPQGLEEASGSTGF